MIEISKSTPALTRKLMSEVEYHSEQLFERGGERDVTGTIAKRLSVSRARVDRARTAIALYWKRRAMALLVGHKAAVEMANDAGRDVIEEV